MGGGGFALVAVPAAKPRRIRSALRRALAQDTLALRASETQRDPPAGIERIERASPLASAALVGLSMAAGIWLYRAHLLDLSHRYGPAIHLIGPLIAVATYLFVRAPTVGEKVDPQKADEEGAGFALNLLFLGILSLVLLAEILTGH